MSEYAGAVPGGGYESFEEMDRIERALDEKIRRLMMGALAEGDDREGGGGPRDAFASAVEAYRQAVRAAVVSARRVLCEPPDGEGRFSPVSPYCADLASLDPVRMDHAAREMCKEVRYGGAVREDVCLLPHRRTYELDGARAAWVQEFYDAAVEALQPFVAEGVIGAPPTLRRPDNFEHFGEWAHQMAEDLRPWLQDLATLRARRGAAKRPAPRDERGATGARSRRRPPMPHQKQIALAFEMMGISETELAATLTQTGVVRKGGKVIAVSQSMVSRAIAAENRRRRDAELPEIKTRKGRKAAAVDPAVLEIGERQDGRARRQRGKKK